MKLKELMYWQIRAIRLKPVLKEYNKAEKHKKRADELYKKYCEIYYANERGDTNETTNN